MGTKTIQVRDLRKLIESARTHVHDPKGVDWPQSPVNKSLSNHCDRQSFTVVHGTLSGVITKDPVHHNDFLPVCICLAFAERENKELAFR